MKIYSCGCLHCAVDLVHSLNEELHPIYGLTTLNNELYVGYKDRDITVYDTQTYNVQRTLQVPGLGAVSDMTSCNRHQCIYIADWKKEAVHRIKDKKKMTKWPVNDKPYGLSVNSAYNVLVTVV
jgi:hypothetical protein